MRGRERTLLLIEKESYRWIAALQEPMAVSPFPTTVVTFYDRDADIQGLPIGGMGNFTVAHYAHSLYVAKRRKEPQMAVLGSKPTETTAERRALK